MVASRARSTALAVGLVVSLLTTGDAVAAGATGAADAADAIGTADAAATSGTERAPTGRPPEIEVTELVGPNGTRLYDPSTINNRGQVLVGLDVGTPDPGEPRYTEVIWRDGAVTRVGPEDRRVSLFDISDRGHIAGVIAAGPDCIPDWVTFRWRRGELTELECGGWGAYPWTVNEQGDILGIDADWRPVVWHEDGRLSVAPESGDAQITAADINDRGVALLVNLKSERSMVWHVDDDRLTDIGDLGGRWTTAHDINEAGHVVGSAEPAIRDGSTHAFLWKDGDMFDLGGLGLPGERWVGAGRINDRGQVIGHSVTETDEVHGFLWQHGRMTDLGSLGGKVTEVVDINNRGQVIGHSETADGSRHAFVWQDGRMIDLTAASGPQATWSWITDINDRGQIVGNTGNDDSSRAVLWTVR